MHNKIQLQGGLRSRLLQDIIAYFREERDEQIGELAAEMLLNLFLEKAGPAIYNQALFDARGWFAERMEGLDADFSLLEKRPPRHK